MGNSFDSSHVRNCNNLISFKEANESFTFYLTYFQSFSENIVSAIYNLPSVKPPKFIRCYKTSKSKEQIPNEAKDYSESDEIWPIPSVEYIFLPEFQKQNGRFNIKIVEMISKGAFGKVYKVEDINSQIYAMKILQKSQVIEQNAIAQVKDEINIQKICGHHQFIVKCLHTWQTRTQLFIVSDFKSGGELLNLLFDYGTLPENIVQIYVAEIAIALDFLHHAGVVYRDLKPENVLLDEDGHVCLTDFGLSKWLSLGSRTNTICGTYHYMAPEILNNEMYTHSVDWWSLGAVSYRLLANEFPIRKDNGVELPNCTGLSAASKDLLQRLLEYDPTKRLRALYALKRIAFFKDFNFQDVLSRKVHPRELLIQYGKENKSHKQANVFENFDENS